jgi:hypothetical protein
MKNEKPKTVNRGKGSKPWQLRRAPRRLAADANKGGRPRLGKTSFRFSCYAETLEALGKAACAAREDKSVFIEKALRVALGLSPVVVPGAASKADGKAGK